MQQQSNLHASYIKVTEFEELRVNFRNGLDLKTEQHPLLAFYFMHKAQTLHTRKCYFLQNLIQLV